MKTYIKIRVWYTKIEPSICPASNAFQQYNLKIVKAKKLSVNFKNESLTWKI